MRENFKRENFPIYGMLLCGSEVGTVITILRGFVIFRVPCQL